MTGNILWDFLAVLGSIASIAGLLIGGKIVFSKTQTITIKQRITNIYNDIKEKSLKSNRHLPSTFIWDLPKVKYNAYIEAHKLWDTGITSKMIEGNNLLAKELFEILLTIAETLVLDTDTNGKGVKKYYKEKIASFSKYSYKAEPNDSGIMHFVVSHSKTFQIIDEYIVSFIRESLDIKTFESWKQKWDNAEVLANQGEDVDFYFGDEL